MLATFEDLIAVTDSYFDMNVPDLEPLVSPEESLVQSPDESLAPSRLEKSGLAHTKSTPLAVRSPSPAVSRFEQQLLATLQNWEQFQRDCPDHQQHIKSVLAALNKEMNKYKYERNRLLHNASTTKTISKEE
jgi:hypothetical protein